jgi:hypothetical protein
LSNLGRRLIKAAREGRAIARGNVRLTCADQIEKTLREIDRDIAQWPDCIKPLSSTCIAEARELTKDVVVSDDEVLPDDVSL